MSRITALWLNQEYQQWLAQVDAAEAKREFCHHGIDHLLAVARIGYILALEDNLQVELRELKEIIYAAALTHDLGRAVTYRHGGDHALESSVIARPLLEKTGFSGKELELVVLAVREHRRMAAGMSTLGRTLYLADKLSRPCETCASRSNCDKIEEMQKIKEFGFY